ncbi:MAG TPA: peptidoglycan bridge formation glycyltransferase FemA/FemB family protein [Spirochaetia bacterium]|nr:peptidoglycan bridge formation glycyltransferase FemA/FemB family protein [Spirochaetia bacterium]
MRGQAGGHGKSDEGQGEIIQVSIRKASLADLDSSEELLQSGWWGNFKQAHGWRAHPFIVTVQDPGKPDASFGLLVLTRRLFRFFTIAYVPFGPTHDPACGRGSFLAMLAAEIRHDLPASALFLRFDLPWEKKGESPDGARGALTVRKSPSDIQPPSTVVVDISGPLEDVMASMKPKTRYNVRLSGKKGVTVQEEGEAGLGAWYAMYQETSRRDRIAIHAPSYYRGLFTDGQRYPGARPTVTLLTARHEGDLLAGNICIFWKKRGVYLTGASSNAKRNLMPTYALQWEAIQKAKGAGCAEYDLYGIPPKPDPEQPMFGLYQFKTGFSDRILERWGTWDVSYRRLLFALYRAAEEIRLSWFRSVRKRWRRR